MKKLSFYSGRTILFFITLSLIFPQNALAYIDPGSGSYLFQLLIAFVLGGLYTIKTYWAMIRAFFNRLFSDGKKDDDIDD